MSAPKIGVVMFDAATDAPSVLRAVDLAGGTPVKFPMRNECCGAYVSLKDPELPVKRSGMVLKSADEAGAEIVVTACPLCLYNLKKNGNGKAEVVYFTELLAEALGVKDNG